MLIVTQEELKEASERRRKYGRKANPVVFSPDFQGRIKDAGKDADELIKRIQQQR
jgi:hypothetical protein